MLKLAVLGISFERNDEVDMGQYQRNRGNSSINRKNTTVGYRGGVELSNITVGVDDEPVRKNLSSNSGARNTRPASSRPSNSSNSSSGRKPGAKRPASRKKAASNNTGKSKRPVSRTAKATANNKRKKAEPSKISKLLHGSKPKKKSLKSAARRAAAIESRKREEEYEMRRRQEETVRATQTLQRVRANKNRSNRKFYGTLAVMLTVCIITGIWAGTRFGTLSKLNEQKKMLEEKYKQQIELSEKLKEEEKYVKTNDYIEQMARKMGLLYPDEVIFKPEEK